MVQVTSTEFPPADSTPCRGKIFDQKLTTLKKHTWMYQSKDYNSNYKENVLALNYIKIYK